MEACDLAAARELVAELRRAGGYELRSIENDAASTIDALTREGEALRKAAIAHVTHTNTCGGCGAPATRWGPTGYVCDGGLHGSIGTEEADHAPTLRPLLAVLGGVCPRCCHIGGHHERCPALTSGTGTEGGAPPPAPPAAGLSEEERNAIDASLSPAHPPYNTVDVYCGVHADWCSGNGACTCGFEALWKQARGAPAPPGPPSPEPTVFYVHGSGLVAEREAQITSIADGAHRNLDRHERGSNAACGIVRGATASVFVAGRGVAPPGPSERERALEVALRRCIAWVSERNLDVYTPGAALDMIGKEAARALAAGSVKAATPRRCKHCGRLDGEGLVIG